MTALVDKKHNTSDKVQTLNILRKRLYDAVLSKELAFVTIESPIMTFVTKIEIDDYQLDEKILYLSGDYEFSLEHNGIEIEHDDMYEEHFILIHNEMKIMLTF